MEHTPASELKKALAEAQEQVHIGSRYTHFKNAQVEYVVTGLGILEATEEVAVIYQSQNADTITFIRPLSSWVETVEYEGKTVPRFSKLP
jgi:hypothetical protein